MSPNSGDTSRKFEVRRMKITILFIVLLPALISAYTAGDICNMVPETGDCDEILYRWYYDSGDSKCNIFEYSGCGGNDNNFVTRVMCEDACSGKRPITFETERICDQASDIGLCQEINKRWYYDADVQMCKLFQYSGCAGNDNNFDTRQECMAKCSGYLRSN
ncbi:boophilin-G2 [Nephila pilipes]|uniref:Boophilin-G2 n=1 Tax=Nephila pilipes TaxID=299642 RepID=A0A8X6QES1_NEPPI|nr:boophilin-G2 [Nephila pilipes]